MCTIVKIAAIVVKWSVTSAWGYELLPANRPIRVSDCSIRVSRSEKSFLCQLCPEIASKFHNNFRFFYPIIILKIIPA